MKKMLTLPGGGSSDHVEFRMTGLSPEAGQVHLRRWGMIGARATSFAKLIVSGEEVVFMDLLPRVVVMDGFVESIYSEDEHRFNACLIGGLRTNSNLRGRGYGTAFLKEVIAELKKRGTEDFICNFVLDERLSFFMDLGWEAVSSDVKVTISQPGATVPLPDKFSFLMYRLKKDFVGMPEETVECIGLPA